MLMFELLVLSTHYLVTVTSEPVQHQICVRDLHFQVLSILSLHLYMVEQFWAYYVLELLCKRHFFPLENIKYRKGMTVKKNFNQSLMRVELDTLSG